jgi:hypothetical protein
LNEAQRRRDDLLAEMSRAEPIRRIAPSARLRAEHLAALKAHGATSEPVELEDGPSRGATAWSSMVSRRK